MANDTQHLFARALRDELSPSEQAAFEQALADPALAREFEAYADAQAGGGLEHVSAWLEHAGESGAVSPGLASGSGTILAQLRAKIEPDPKRGRLIPLFAAAAAVAAAAAIIIVMNVHSGVMSPEPWPENTPGEVSVMDQHRYFERELEDFHPANGVVLNISKGTLLLPGDDHARLVSGSLRAKTDDDSYYSILVGDNRIEMASAATIAVEVEPHHYTETQFTENDPMLKPKVLARFGAHSFAFTLTVMAGTVTLHAAPGTQTLTAPQTIQAQAKPPRPAPPKVEDIFSHLDINADGKLDNTEVPQRMIDDFDDDGSGDINVDEFKAHHKPPRHGEKPEELFANLDKNGDAVLDSAEVPQKMIDDMDDDASGDISVAEFKTHHKPAKPAQPKVEDHFSHLDVNGDGKLDDTELPDELLAKLDGDADGEVTLGEFKANHKPPQPPKPEDEFAKLDANGDGVVDDTETDQKMIEDFDDDASGDIDLAEFKQHWRPRPPKPEDLFDDLDKNDDGKLDAEELPLAVVNDWDDDANGSVSLDEFKAHHRPPHGPDKGPGPGGPGKRPGPGGPGKGPGGPGPK